MTKSVSHQTNYRLYSNKLPDGRDGTIYKNINDIIEENIDSKFYLSSGYLNTVTKYTEKQKSKERGLVTKFSIYTNLKTICRRALFKRKITDRKNLICDLREGIGAQRLKGRKPH